MKRTGGTETSKYPQEKKTIVIPSVEASESGIAQTGSISMDPGLWGPDVGLMMGRRAVWKVRP